MRMLYKLYSYIELTTSDLGFVNLSEVNIFREKNNFRERALYYFHLNLAVQANGGGYQKIALDEVFKKEDTCIFSFIQNCILSKVQPQKN